MLLVRTTQLRRSRKATACCIRLIQSRGRWPTIQGCCVDDNAANHSKSYYSTYRAPTTFSPLGHLGGNCHNHRRRSFSKSSADEIAIQDHDPPPSAPKNNAAATATGTSTPTAAAAKSSSLESNNISKTSFDSVQQPTHGDDVLPKKIQGADHNAIGQQLPPRETITNGQLIVELQGAHELFHRIYTESRALLRNNRRSATTTITTSDEVVAMADYFMILVNSLDLEKRLELVQSLQRDRRDSRAAERKEQNKEKDACSVSLEGEGAVVEEKLRQAVKSMSQLHHVFLSMVKSSLPLNNPSVLTKDSNGQHAADDIIICSPSFDKELHSATTVGRALQLSRRANELGMPLHRPLYQRMAMGIVLTSSSETPIAEPSPPALSGAVHGAEDVSNEVKEPSNTEPTTLISEGHSQQIDQSLHNPPLVLELLDMFEHARSAHKIGSGEQLQQFAEDLLADPFLFLLKSKRWEDATTLLHEWDALSGHDSSRSIDLMDLLGEHRTFDALEIAKDWLAGCTQFEEDLRTNSHAIRLTGILEEALGELVKVRKQRAENISRLLSQLPMQSEDGQFGEDRDDADYEFEVDFDFDADGGEDSETQTATASTSHSNSLVVLSDEEKTEPLYFGSSEDHSAEDDDALKAGNEQSGMVASSTIIKGLSDNEARQSIYVRNGVDWVLPDIVPQLEDWNKGKQLAFTPMFERYLGQQIMKEQDEDDD